MIFNMTRNRLYLVCLAWLNDYESPLLICFVLQNVSAELSFLTCCIYGVKDGVD